MTTLDDSPRTLALETSLTRLVFSPQGAELEAARQCEADVFLDRFGDGRELLDEWFASHEDVSHFLALIAEDGTAVAAARLILPGPAGFKVSQSLDEDWHVDPDATMAAVGLDPSTTWDVGSISVRPRAKGSTAMWTAALCHGLFEVARVNGVSATIAVMDEGARERLAMMGIVYHAFPGCSPMPYCGSPASVPVHADMATMVSNQRRHLPEAHRLITLGMGLEGVAVPGPAGFVVPGPSVVDLRQPSVLPAPRH